MWRRFVPKKLPTSNTSRGTQLLKAVRSSQQADELVSTLRSSPTPQDLHERITHYRTLLIAQTPQAVRAQWQMDAHKHGYHHRQKRLYELIDFNDTFVNLVLATPLHQRATLLEPLKLDMDQFCRKLHNPCFSNEQFEAIAKGLGREIAVYTAAEQLGYTVRMTSRTQDAFGIDMMIMQPGTNKRLYIDCKTPSAFRHRLEDLLKQGHINEQELLDADKNDFLTRYQHHNGDEVPVTLLCIRPDTVGQIRDFALEEPAMFKHLIDKVFASVDERKVLDIFAKKW